METVRTLRKLGGSTSVTIPPEMLAQLGLAEGSEVVIRTAGSRLEIERADLSDEYVRWVHDNIQAHDELYRRLAAYDGEAG
jgi:antitoxin component of MazEF toxin-antitoxin module